MGRLWKAEIERALQATGLLIAVIGPGWEGPSDDDGRPRIQSEADVVRREIAVALASGSVVIPLLVDGARLPSADQLPDDLKGLRAGHVGRIRPEQVSDNYFEDDIARLRRIVSEWRREQHEVSRKPRPHVARPKPRGRLNALARRVLEASLVPPKLTKTFRSSIFLREDPEADIRDYFAEKPLAGYLPYVEIKNWTHDLWSARKITVTKKEGTHSLDSWGPGDGDALREEAYAQAYQKEPKPFNGPAVRVLRATPDADELHLTVQRSEYDNQIRSNLAMDFRSRRPGADGTTLRAILRQTSKPGRLPALDDGRLANTLGVAVLLAFVENGIVQPYLTKRTSEGMPMSAGGEYHCTASGVAELNEQWPHTDPVFWRDSMLRELDEEVGLLEHDLEYIEPVAFCREMMRGGKPQLFFLGLTNLTRTELTARMKSARRRVKGGSRPIVENTGAIKTLKPQALARKLSGGNVEAHFTVEAEALLYYFERCRHYANSV